jgi:class 3 adenylate cyclase
MHKELFENLPGARGVSEHVIAIFLDIRGFSSFAKIEESNDTAMFLRKMYLKILSEYFTDPSFFKPTGDGLMIIYAHEEEKLSEVATKSVATALTLVGDFPDLLATDPMINFTVPTELGIGVARGGATRLASGELTLDYSGRPLNVAARLMDLARPLGVVTEASFTEAVVGTESHSRFTESSAYVKGIAEDESMKILLVEDWTRIPDSARRPIGKYDWYHQQVRSTTLAEARVRSPVFIHELSKQPAFPGQIVFNAFVPMPTASGRRSAGGLSHIITVTGDFLDNAGTPEFNADYATFVEIMEGLKVNPSWEIKFKLSYRVLPDSI